MIETKRTDGIEQIRGEVRSWLQQHWDPELSLIDWRRQLADSGWACPEWPVAWSGRGLPASCVTVVADEIAELGAVGIPEGVGMHLAAPTILEHASDAVKSRFLRETVTGKFRWCQLFSEPGSGSDLAGLTTRADLDGEEWVVKGQKLWSTSAGHADFGLLLARTDWDAPKHRGITYFILPMRQPGVDVRPLRQMNGHSSFNEVFLDEARLPAEFVVGDVNQGWSVALTTLAHERRLAPGGRATRARSTSDGRALREAAEESARVSEPYRWYPQRAGRVNLVIPQAKANGRAEDPLVRQEIARLICLVRASEWTAKRAAAARALGRPPGPEGSLGKLASSNIARAAARVHSLIAGSSGMLAGPESALEGIIAEIILSVPAVSIAGGTDEIQRNIIAERVLGLPKDPDQVRDVPFRDVRTNSDG